MAHYLVFVNDELDMEVLDPTCQSCDLEANFKPNDLVRVVLYSVDHDNQRSQPSDPFTFPFVPTDAPTQPTLPVEASSSVSSPAPSPSPVPETADDLIPEPTGSAQRREFVAVYEYDPENMSPNDDVAEELPLAVDEVS